MVGKPETGKSAHNFRVARYRPETVCIRTHGSLEHLFRTLPEETSRAIFASAVENGRPICKRRRSDNWLPQDLRCLYTRVDHDGGMNPDRNRDSCGVVNRLHAGYSCNLE